jgi:hypothetical protein
VVLTIAKNRSLGAAALVFIFVRLLTTFRFFLTVRFFLGFFLEVVGFGVVSVLGVVSGVLGGVLSVGVEPPDPLGGVSVGVEPPEPDPPLLGMGLLELEGV